jgi:hypothetical protein
MNPGSFDSDFPCGVGPLIVAEASEQPVEIVAQQATGVGYLSQGGQRAFALRHARRVHWARS